MGVVYSTNPDYDFEFDNGNEDETLDPADQVLRLRIEKKGRGGKVVTIVDGFEGTGDDLSALAKRLKSSCGVGGSAKDGVVVLQGDVWKKAAELLKSWGYKNSK